MILWFVVLFVVASSQGLLVAAAACSYSGTGSTGTVNADGTTMTCGENECNTGTISGCSEVICNGDYSCQYATINVEPDRTVACSGSFSCYGATIQSAERGSGASNPTETFQSLVCTSARACQYATVSDMKALECRGSSACYGITTRAAPVSVSPYVICEGEFACEIANFNSISCLNCINSNVVCLDCKVDGDAGQCPSTGGIFGAACPAVPTPAPTTTCTSELKKNKCIAKIKQACECYVRPAFNHCAESVIDRDCCPTNTNKYANKILNSGKIKQHLKKCP